MYAKHKCWVSKSAYYKKQHEVAKRTWIIALLIIRKREKSLINETFMPISECGNNIPFSPLQVVGHAFGLTTFWRYIQRWGARGLRGCSHPTFFQIIITFKQLRFGTLFVIFFREACNNAVFLWKTHPSIRNSTPSTLIFVPETAGCCTAGIQLTKLLLRISSSFLLQLQLMGLF